MERWESHEAIVLRHSPWRKGGVRSRSVGSVVPSKRRRARRSRSAKRSTTPLARGVAAEASASPQLRVALEAAANPDDEADLENALEALTKPPEKKKRRA